MMKNACDWSVDRKRLSCFRRMCSAFMLSNFALNMGIWSKHIQTLYFVNFKEGWLATSKRRAMFHLDRHDRPFLGEDFADFASFCIEFNQFQELSWRCFNLKATPLLFRWGNRRSFWATGPLDRSWQMEDTMFGRSPSWQRRFWLPEIDYMHDVTVETSISEFVGVTNCRLFAVFYLGTEMTYSHVFSLCVFPMCLPSGKWTIVTENHDFPGTIPLHFTELHLFLTWCVVVFEGWICRFMWKLFP